MKESYPSHREIDYDPWVDEKQDEQEDEMPPMEELLDEVKKRVLSGGAMFMDGTPLAFYQLCDHLAAFIIADCDGLQHLDETGPDGRLRFREPTHEEIRKAICLKSILDCLTDSPCLSALENILSSKGRKKYQKRIQEALDRLQEKPAWNQTEENGTRA